MNCVEVLNSLPTGLRMVATIGPTCGFAQVHGWVLLFTLAHLHFSEVEAQR